MAEDMSKADINADVSFFKIAAELRNKIYELALPRGLIITNTNKGYPIVKHRANHGFHSPYLEDAYSEKGGPLEPAVLRTCQRLRQEMKSMYYSRQICVFSPKEMDTSNYDLSLSDSERKAMSPLKVWLRHLGAERLRHICNIEVNHPSRTMMLQVRIIRNTYSIEVRETYEGSNLCRSAMECWQETYLMSKICLVLLSKYLKDRQLRPLASRRTARVQFRNDCPDPTTEEKVQNAMRWIAENGVLSYEDGTFVVDETESGGIDLWSSDMEEDGSDGEYESSEDEEEDNEDGNEQ